MFVNKLPQLSLFLGPTQFTSSSHTKLIKINFVRRLTWSCLSAVVAEAWASFVSTEYRTKVRFVIISLHLDLKQQRSFFSESKLNYSLGK